MIYNDITTRAKQSALDILPDLPKENTLESWESFQDALESMRDDSHDLAWQEVDSWDWSIYTHYGIKVLDCLPLEELNQAESEFFDLWGGESIDTLTSVWDMASRVAFLALVNAMCEALETAIDELSDLAETQIENLEGESV